MARFYFILAWKQYDYLESNRKFWLIYIWYLLPLFDFAWEIAKNPRFCVLNNNCIRLLKKVHKIFKDTATIMQQKIIWLWPLGLNSWLWVAKGSPYFGSNAGHCMPLIKAAMNRL